MRALVFLTSLTACSATSTTYDANKSATTDAHWTRALLDGLNPFRLNVDAVVDAVESELDATDAAAAHGIVWVSHLDASPRAITTDQIKGLMGYVRRTLASDQGAQYRALFDGSAREHLYARWGVDADDIGTPAFGAFIRARVALGVHGDDAPGISALAEPWPLFDEVLELEDPQFRPASEQAAAYVENDITRAPMLKLTDAMLATITGPSERLGQHYTKSPDSRIAILGTLFAGRDLRPTSLATSGIDPSCADVWSRLKNAEGELAAAVATLQDAERWNQSRGLGHAVKLLVSKLADLEEEAVTGRAWITAADDAMREANVAAVVDAARALRAYYEANPATEPALPVACLEAPLERAFDLIFERGLAYTLAQVLHLSDHPYHFDTWNPERTEGTEDDDTPRRPSTGFFAPSEPY